MKRLTNKTFQNIDTVFWQLFYIDCYSQLINNIMYEVKMKFWCNAGHTEEEVNVPIYENCGTEDEQIQDYFEVWLDNNEDVGYERLP